MLGAGLPDVKKKRGPSNRNESDSGDKYGDRARVIKPPAAKRIKTSNQMGKKGSGERKMLSIIRSKRG